MPFEPAHIVVGGAVELNCGRPLSFKHTGMIFGGMSAGFWGLVATGTRYKRAGRRWSPADELKRTAADVALQVD